MEDVLQALVSALRSSGIRISVAETLDAMRAVRLMGYYDRQRLKDSLSAVLAKSKAEKEIFDSCFDRYFSADGFSGVEEEPCPAREDLASEGDAPLSRMVLEGDSAGLSIALQEAGDKLNVRGIRFFTQKGLYVQRILQDMGMEGLEGDIQALLQEGGSAARRKAEALRTAREVVFQRVKDFVERQYFLFAGSATEEVLEKYLKEMRLSNLEQRDFQHMQKMIQRMVKRLNQDHSRRKKSSKRGALDFKRTLRKNLAYHGVLFNPQWKMKRPDRPEVVVVCDVSRSVQAIARFMLLFLYGLNEAVDRITSFIFCSNLVHVSDLFEEYTVEEALNRLQKGIGLGIILGRTDYSRVFREFKDQWMEKLTKRTTLLILGDARNNYGNPETETLRLLRDRSKRLVWLNPEPPAFWGTGDSEMKRYLPYCSLARECSTLNHLERAVDLLLKAN